MSDRLIVKVAVVGGGLTAWSAAAALKRRIPSIEVTLVPAPVAADALADRIISTTPSIHGFHRDIGLTQVDTVTGAASGLRAGTLFEGWAEGLPSYVHAYGPYGAPIEGIAFHQLWLRERQSGSLPPFDHFSPAAELARSGASPKASSDSIEFGLQLTLERYAALIRDYALHVGVRLHRAPLTDVAIRSEDGFVDRLVCGDSADVAADLFVDCTGPAALVHSHLDSAFVDWSSWLLCDRLAFTSAAADPTLVSMDRVSALGSGWRWAASSPQVSSHGLSYSSGHPFGEDIGRGLDDSSSDTIALRQGRKPQFWIRNCLAIGDAAVSVEPLEWTNLHLAHSQIDRMIDMMPGRDCAPVELADFNRQSTAEADRVRDFICMHYVCSRRSEPFWKDAASVTPPDSLAHTLTLFKERGRLPFYEEDTFSKDSWLAVLLGQGFEPERINPLTGAVSSADAMRALTASSFTLPSASSTLNSLNPRGIR